MGEYAKTNLYCVNCGSLSVWEEVGAGVKYEGNPIHICAECKTHFELPESSTHYSKAAIEEIVSSLR